MAGYAANVTGRASTNRVFEAERYGPDEEGIKLFLLEEGEHEVLEETIPVTTGGDDDLTLVSHGVTYGLDARLPEERSWEVGAEDSWSIGTLSTPKATVDGTVQSPFAREPLPELLADDIGWKLLSALGVTVDGEWKVEPEELGTERVEMLGETTEAGVYGGVLETDAGQAVIAAYLARTVTEDDVVIAGAVDRRALSEDAEGGDDDDDEENGDDEDGHFEFVLDEDDLEAIKNRLEMAVKLYNSVLPIPHGEDIPEPLFLPFFNIEDPRLVQICENSKNVSTGEELDDPPLIPGEETTALFDIEGGNFYNFDDESVMVRVTLTQGELTDTTDWFWIPKDDLEDIISGDSPAVKFHELARDDDEFTDPPIFTYLPDEVTVSIESSGNQTVYDSVTWSIDEGIETPPLVVGFIQIVDPREGNGDEFAGAPITYGDEDGEAKHYERTVNSAVEYLSRVIPGSVAAYRLDTPIEAVEHEQDHDLLDEVGEDNWDWDDFETDEVLDVNDDYHRDAEEARTTMNELHAATTGDGDSGLPGGLDYNSMGEFVDTRVVEGWAEEQFLEYGFDVVVMIAPEGRGPERVSYYQAHGRCSDEFDTCTVGLYSGQHRAVGSLETRSSINDIDRAQTVAHEIGHYFASEPYEPPDFARADYDNDEWDEEHASEDLESIGYSLGRPWVSREEEPSFSLISSVSIDDGSFDPGEVYDTNGNLSPRSNTSYMSYDDHRQWSDCQIVRYLAKSQFDEQYGSSSGVVIQSLQGGASTPDGVGAGAPVAAGDAVTTDGDDGPLEAGEGTHKPDVEPVFELFGRVEREKLHLERSTVYHGRPQDPERARERIENSDAEPVYASLLDPDRETLHTIAVPDRTELPHHDEPIDRIAISLPFHEQGIWVRTTYGSDEQLLNAIVRPLRDSVRRIPDRGLAERAVSRRQLYDRLNQTDQLMKGEGYGKAAEFLRKEFVSELREHIVEYDSLANEPTVEVMLALTERQARRLDRLR